MCVVANMRRLSSSLYYYAWKMRRYVLIICWLLLNCASTFWNLSSPKEPYLFHFDSTKYKQIHSDSYTLYTTTGTHTYTHTLALYTTTRASSPFNFTRSISVWVIVGGGGDTHIDNLSLHCVPPACCRFFVKTLENINSWLHSSTLAREKLGLCMCVCVEQSISQQGHLQHRIAVTLSLSYVTPDSHYNQAGSKQSNTHTKSTRGIIITLMVFIT